MITEHWLSKEEIDLFTIDNFRKVSFSVRNDRKGGGVMILLRNGIQCETEDLPQVKCLSEDMLCEMAATKLSYMNTSWIIMGVYRSPSVLPHAASSSEETSSESNWSRFLDILQEGLIECNPAVSNLCLVGDFNIDFLKASSRFTQLKDLFESCNLVPTFSCGTRLNLNSGKFTCIDNICTNCPNLLSDPKVLRNQGHFDHEMLSVNLSFAMGKANDFILKRKFDKNSLMNFKRALEGEKWSEVYTESNACKAYDAFISTFKFHMDVHCPTMRVKRDGNRKENVNIRSPDTVNC